MKLTKLEWCLVVVTVIALVVMVRHGIVNRPERQGMAITGEQNE